MSLIKDPRKTIHAISNRVVVNVPMATIDLDYIVRNLDYKFISDNVDVEVLCGKIDWGKYVGQTLEYATQAEIENLIGSKLSLGSLSDVTLPAGAEIKTGDMIAWDSTQEKWVISNKQISPVIENPTINVAVVNNSTMNNSTVDNSTVQNSTMNASTMNSSTINTSNIEQSTVANSEILASIIVQSSMDGGTF